MTASVRGEDDRPVVGDPDPGAEHTSRTPRLHMHGNHTFFLYAVVEVVEVDGLVRRDVHRSAVGGGRGDAAGRDKGGSGDLRKAGGEGETAAAGSGMAAVKARVL